MNKTACYAQSFSFLQKKRPSRQEELFRMKRYDLYVYEPGSDVVVGWHKFEAVGNISACEIVQRLGLSGRIELWADDEIVDRWEAP
jgi:hypothetical protein